MRHTYFLLRRNYQSREFFIRIFVLLSCISLFSLGLSCSRFSTQVQDTPDAGTQLRARALAIVSGEQVPSRPEAIALAQQLAQQASEDPALEANLETYRLAASVMEAVFRSGSKLQDGHEAQDLYALAGAKSELQTSCTSALVGARLAGELSQDPEQAYGELYRLRLRLPDGACRTRAQAELTALSAYAPRPEVLDAIRHTLLASGQLAASSAGDVKLPALTPGTQVLKIEKWVTAEDARVVITLDHASAFRVVDDVTPGGKPRTAVEIEGASPGPIASEIVATGLATLIRADKVLKGTRISVELSEKAYRKVFHLLEPYRIVIDLARNPPGKGRKVARVVLDPGHGGTDPGASSGTGLQEKDVTLDIAHRVAPLLAKDGISVVLTRDDDRYVSLEERTARANSASADLFVSIHCNASEGKGRSGLETYVLDTSTSDMEARVATRENATSAQATAELSSILANMRIADQSQRSAHLGELLQRAALASVRQVRPLAIDGGVHRAGFYVLVGARMPGVLFETSYISHTEEGVLLGTPDYRARLADGITNAIRAYREGK
jgi:N-acetylmuramoyl-L-alanine amidase